MRKTSRQKDLGKKNGSFAGHFFALDVFANRTQNVA
jgi:hypothetical protein